MVDVFQIWTPESLCCGPFVRTMIIRTRPVGRKPLQRLRRDSDALRHSRPCQASCPWRACALTPDPPLLRPFPPASALQNLVERTWLPAADRIRPPVPRSAVADHLPAGLSVPLDLDLEPGQPQICDRWPRIRALHDLSDACPGKAAPRLVDPPHIPQVPGLQASLCHSEQAVGTSPPRDSSHPFAARPNAWRFP